MPCSCDLMTDDFIGAGDAPRCGTTVANGGIWIRVGLIILLLVLPYGAFSEDTKFDGHALYNFSEVGAWGWFISVDRVRDGPQDMVGQNISVYLTSADPDRYPPGSIDPNIAIGDNVSVYGSLQTYGERDRHVLLVGFSKYYIRPESQEDAAAPWWQFWKRDS